MTFGSTSYFYLTIPLEKGGNLYLVAVSKSAATNAAMVFEILCKIASLGKIVLGGNFNEESLKDKFTEFYELLDG